MIRLIRTVRNTNYLLSLITAISIIIHKPFERDVRTLLPLATDHIEKPFSWLFTSTKGSCFSCAVLLNL